MLLLILHIFKKKNPKIYGQMSKIKLQSHMRQSLNKILALTKNS